MSETEVQKMRRELSEFCKETDTEYERIWEIVYFDMARKLDVPECRRYGDLDREKCPIYDFSMNHEPSKENREYDKSAGCAFHEDSYDEETLRKAYILMQEYKEKNPDWDKCDDDKISIMREIVSEESDDNFNSSKYDNDLFKGFELTTNQIDKNVLKLNQENSEIAEDQDLLNEWKIRREKEIDAETSNSIKSWCRDQGKCEEYYQRMGILNGAEDAEFVAYNTEAESIKASQHQKKIDEGVIEE